MSSLNSTKRNMEQLRERALKRKNLASNIKHDAREENNFFEMMKNDIYVQIVRKG